MSFAEYSSRLPTLFPTDAATASGPPAGTIETPDGEQGSSREKNTAKTLRVDNVNLRTRARSPSSTSRRRSRSTRIVKKPPSKGFVDIVEYHHVYPDRDPRYFLTEKFVPSTKASSRPIWGGESERKFEDYAIILRRIWAEPPHGSKSCRVVGIQLEIHSEPLCIWLREIATKTYNTCTDLETFPIKFQSPFRELFFYRAEIQALAEDDSIDENLRRDAKALNEFVHQPNGLLASIIEDHKKFLKEGKVLSDILWTIFPPRSLLVLDTGPIKECWICLDVVQQRGSYGGKEWVIKGANIWFDGLSPCLGVHQFVIDNPSTGLRLLAISDLPLTPIGQYKARDLLEDALRRRYGTLSMDLGTDLRLSSFTCKSYSGAAWDGDKTYLLHGKSPNLTAKRIDDLVIVDFKSAVQGEVPGFIEKTLEIPYNRGNFTARGIIPVRGRYFRPRIRRRRSSRSDSSSSNSSDSETERLRAGPEGLVNALTYDPIVKNSLTTDSSGMLNRGTLDRLAEAACRKFEISKEEFVMLFPALVPAFGLKSNKWRLVLSDGLQDVDWSTAHFESMQHDQHTKSLLETLVKGYKAECTASDAMLAQKEQGLVLHLHGGHGLGKTFTAECIAGYLERPLYHISGRSLSNEVDSVEEKIHEIFYDAKRWGAVLLLKEADVLFGKRVSGDLATKNPATSRAFLRAIEDYQGTLILMTNEKKDLNEDIKSLIHLTIRYPALSSEAQARIWENLTQATRNIETDKSWNDAVYGELGKLCLNGRTIKSTLRTAVTFANAEEKPLGARHVLAILRTELSAEDFKDDEGKWEKQVQPALHKLHEMLDIPFQQG